MTGEPETKDETLSNTPLLENVERRPHAAPLKPYFGLGGDPCMLGEELEEFNHLTSELLTLIKPRDLMERLWFVDFAHNQWELQRLRRLAPFALMAGHTAFLDKLQSVMRKGREEALECTHFGVELRSGLNLVPDGPSLDAGVLLVYGAQLETLDKRMALLEDRRDAVLKKLEDYRSGLASPTRPLNPIVSPSLREGD